MKNITFNRKTADVILDIYLIETPHAMLHEHYGYIGLIHNTVALK